jgi:hypothetical protein
MNLKNWNHVARLALLLPLIAAAGCTGSDVLTPQTGSFRLQVEIVNVPPGYRFGDGDSDRARFRMLQIEVRPDDPNAAAVLGEDNMFLLRTPVGINYDVTPKTIWTPDSSPPGFPPPMSTGTWRIMSVEIDLFNFRDAEAPLSEDTCADFIERYRTDEFDGSIFLQNFDQDFRFSIEHDADNSYSLIIDWGAFMEAFQEAWPCDQFCPSGDAWCLQDFAAFRRDIFGDSVPDFLTFE